MNKFKIALVGCGDISKETAFICRMNRKIASVACVDLDFEKAERFAKKYKIQKAYSDYETMLDKENPDAIYLAVPHHLHLPMVSQAVERGHHVLCEKPAAATLDQALEMCAMVKKSDRKVGINYQYRYDKACYAIAHAAHNGELGELYYACCNVPWHREKEYFNQSKWHASLEQAGGGTLITQASHIIDVAMWILGSVPKAASGITKKMKFKDVEVEDLFMGSVEMENGCLIQLSSSMVAQPERCINMEIYGSHGTGLYQGRFFPKSRFEGVKIRRKKPPVGGIHAFVASIEAFRRWSVADQAYAMPIENALPVMAVVDAMYRSAGSGKTEPVDNRYLKFLDH